MEHEELTALAEACRGIGISVDQALLEKRYELTIRQFLRCLPGDNIKVAQIPEFLKEMLGEEPSADLVERVVVQVRGPAISEDDYLTLEKAQFGRCGLCGELLTVSAGPQVDHKIPVALGGKSYLENYQLLCTPCNGGKKALVGWIMGAPFLREGPGYKLRYCVLTRFQGTCATHDCGATARTHRIEVLPVVPIQRGGRWIFDNLAALCSDHAADSRAAWKSDAYSRLRTLSRNGAWNPA